ncbi:hypothetical protein CVS40_12058 [Lucilia cuprina]|nr:hypothetical protein CVS40_12058 [Lucilia cuprina]
MIIKCQMKNFIRIKRCWILTCVKLVQRVVVAFDFIVKLHQVPVNNVSLSAFLYNVSADFCQLMKNGKKYPFLNIFILLLAKDSNINHTCPYDVMVIVRRLILRDHCLQICLCQMVIIYLTFEWEPIIIGRHFTNIKCLEYDKPFASIQICKLKLVARAVVAMNLHVKLHQVPVNNVSIHVELLKKFSGYRPFLYNGTADFCQLMKNGKRFPFLNIFMHMLTNSSNINHTCPYDHDIIVKNLIIKDQMFQKFPLPQGDYFLNIKVGAYNDWKACIKVYFQTW